MSGSTRVQGLQSLITTVAEAERRHEGDRLRWDGHELGSGTWRSRLVERWQIMTKGRSWVDAEHAKMRQSMIEHFVASITREFGDSLGVAQKQKLAKLLDERESTLVSLQELKAQQHRGEIPSAASLMKLVTEVQNVLLNDASLGEHARRVQLAAQQLSKIDMLGGVMRQPGFRLESDVPYRIKLSLADDGSVMDSIAIDHAIGMVGRQISFQAEEIERYDSYRRSLLAEGDRLVGVERSLKATIAAISMALEDANTEVEHGERMRAEIFQAKAALAENEAIGNRLFEQYQEADAKQQLAISRKHDAIDLLSRLFIHVGASELFADEPKQALMSMLNQEFSLHQINPPPLDATDRRGDLRGHQSLAEQIIRSRDRVAADTQAPLIAKSEAAHWQRPDWGDSKDRELARVMASLGDKALLQAIADQHAPEWLAARAHAFAGQAPSLAASRPSIETENAGWFGKISKFCVGIVAAIWSPSEALTESNTDVLKKKYVEHLEQCVAGDAAALQAYASANRNADGARRSDDEIRQAALGELIRSSRDLAMRCLTLCACRFDTQEAFLESPVGKAMNYIAPEITWETWSKLGFDEALKQFSAIAMHKPIDPAIFEGTEGVSSTHEEMLAVVHSVAAILPDVDPTTTEAEGVLEIQDVPLDAAANYDDQDIDVNQSASVDTKAQDPVSLPPSAISVSTPLHEQCLKLASMCLEERLDHYLSLAPVQRAVERYKLQGKVEALREAAEQELRRRFASPLAQGESATTRFDHFGRFLAEQIRKIVNDLPWNVRAVYWPFASRVEGKLNDVELFVAAQIEQFEQAKQLALSPTP